MGLGEWLTSKKGKTFMGYLYGIGASVVIVGALFKIQHWPFAGPMLIVGLGTEAVIFFFSAFEPVHMDLDWSLVYPELAHTTHEEGAENQELLEETDKGTVTEQLDKMLEEAKIGPELIESLGAGLIGLKDQTAKLNQLTDASVATEEFVSNVKGASSSASHLSNSLSASSTELTEAYSKTAQNISKSAELVTDSYSKTAEKITEKLSASAGELSDAYSKTAQNISKSATVVTDSYSKTAEKITETLSASANELSDAYSKTAQNISKSATVVTDSYSKTAEQLNRSAAESAEQITRSAAETSAQLKSSATQLSDSYIASAESFKNEMAGSLEKSGSFQQQMQNVTANLSSLNSSYENQLKELNDRMADTGKLYSGIEQLLRNLNDSVEDTRKYKEGISELSKNLSALNTVYGNMLSAMSYQNK